MYVFLVLALVVSDALATKIHRPNDSKYCGTSNTVKPTRCGYNEQYVKCKTTCPPQSCDISYTEYLCGPKTCEPGCDCIKDHLRNASNICIPNNECPPPKIKPTRCGYNEQYVKCKTTCPPQSCDISYTEYLCGPKTCEPGCDCIKDHLRNASNICIPNNECPPPKSTQCGLNETYVDCAFRCPNQNCPEDDSLIQVACKPGRPCPPGCACKDGYRRKSENDDTCILASDCPRVKCTRPNEVWDPCSSNCLDEKCEDVNNKQSDCEAPAWDCRPRCVCRKNFCRDKDDICVSSKDYKNPKTTTTTTTMKPKCSTKPSSASKSSSQSESQSSSSSSSSSASSSSSSTSSSSSSASANCEETKAPTPTEPQCGPNEVTSDCKIVCPPQSCESIYTLYKCQAQLPCEPGCNCKKGYLRDRNNKCIPSEKCPAPKPKPKPNEVASDCKKVCPSQSCESIYTAYYCENRPPCEPGCNFKSIAGDERNRKIAPSPPTEPQCGPNEVASDCKIVCPPQSCASIYTLYNCQNRPPCEPGCNCKKGYLRDGNNTCIPSEQCSGPTPTEPQCGPNEVASDCKIVCPPQSCESIYSSYFCENSPPCEPGCNCKDGYLRDKNNTCIPSEQCSAPTPTEPQCGPNEVASDCKIVCPPQSCESIYSSYNCENRPPCEPGCDCKDGYLRDANNVCIPSDKCPTGTQCGLNETYVDCAFRCPNQNCPEDDSLVQVACKPGRPCPPGCACKDGYRRKSENDDTCILASDCPRVKCTKPNEVWDPCSSDCLVEKCEDVNNEQSGCEAPASDCRPRCVCRKNFCRDKDDICVPSKDCKNTKTTTTTTTRKPKCSTKPSSTSKSSSQSESRSTSSSSSSSASSSSSSSTSSSSSSASTNCEETKGTVCQPTCAEPNPPNCQSRLKNNSPKSNGTCQDGYILSEKGGKCIKIEDCPKGCNGDPNAVAKACPAACPSTCDKPNSLPCKKECTPLGCECASGYIRSKENGKCILPSECPGGNPCRSNETFVACKSGCPTDYCPTSDSRAVVICESYPFSPCFSGCVCELNHKRLSRKDDRCIVASECPPVKCTRPNEEWNPCPSECRSEYCESANQGPVTCNTLVLNCQPRCTCKKNYFRNADDICIPAKDCPKN